MTAVPITPASARATAEATSEAIRTLNHATLPANGWPGLQYPSHAYDMLGALHEIAAALPQLLEQISAFLLLQLQRDVIAVEGGEFAGDPLGAIGTASHHLEQRAVEAAVRLAEALNAAQQATAFARYIHSA